MACFGFPLGPTEDLGLPGDVVFPTVHNHHSSDCFGMNDGDTLDNHGSGSREQGSRKKDRVTNQVTHSTNLAF